jgi:hypothetical protein
MGWLRRRLSRRRPAHGVEPVSQDAILVKPLICTHSHERDGNLGHHWNDPTALTPNLPHDRLLTLAAERRARRAQAAARHRRQRSALYPADGDWHNWSEGR